MKYAAALGLLCVLDRPAEGTEFRRFADVKHIIVQYTREVQKTVVCFHFLVADKILDRIDAGVGGILLHYHAKAVIGLHVFDNLRSHCQVLVCNIIYTVVSAVLCSSDKAEQEVNEIMYAAEMETIFACAVYKLRIILRST